MYYIIDLYKNGERLYYIMDITDNDDVSRVKNIYKSFYNGLMFKNFYPIEFLDTMKTDNNIIKINPFVLLKLYCKWYA